MFCFDIYLVISKIFYRVEIVSKIFSKILFFNHYLVNLEKLEKSWDL